jgi:hypothetical protein
MIARAHPHVTEQHDEEPWYADSGANNHVTTTFDNLTLQEPFKGDDEVAIGNGTSLPISNTGSFILYHSKIPFKLNNILHCPTAAVNLLSIQKLCVDNKCWFILTDSYFFIKDNCTGQTLLQGLNKDGLYPILLSKAANKSKRFTAYIGISTSSVIWHRRLGHPAPPIINKLRQNAQLPILGVPSHQSLCESCQVAKSKCLPFSESNNVSFVALEIIHSDLWSSLIPSLSGCRYYVKFIDNFTHFSWIYPIQN